MNTGKTYDKNLDEGERNWVTRDFLFCLYTCNSVLTNGRTAIILHAQIILFSTAEVVSFCLSVTRLTFCVREKCSFIFFFVRKRKRTLDKCSFSISCIRPFFLCQPPKAPFIATTTKPEIPCLSPELLLVLAGEADADLVAEEYDDNCDCEICKYTVGQFNACLQRNSTQSIINTFYHKLCQNLPPPMQLNCVDIVAKHFMTLIRDVSDLDPIKACSDDCRPHTELALGDVDVKTTNSCLCQRCQGLIKEYANDMASPDRQQFAVSYFTRICTFMPTTSISNKCKETANSYLPELMNMLSHVDPVSTCSHFKYCQKKAPWRDFTLSLDHTSNFFFFVDCVNIVGVGMQLTDTKLQTVENTLR